MPPIASWALERPWAILLLIPLLMVVVAGILEYAMTGGTSGWIPLLAGAGGVVLVGGGLLVLLWLEKSGQSFTSATPIPLVPTLVVAPVLALLVAGLVIRSASVRVRGEHEQALQDLQRTLERSKRVLSRKSPSELIALTKGRTQIEAEAVTKLYIGTWLAVQGRVRDVIGRGDTVDVLLRPEEPHITAAFDMRWFDRVKSYLLENQ